MNGRRIESAGQRGVALFVCLAMLLVLGIAGTSAVRTTILEERMVRNAGDGLVAFHAAEAALREGEAFLAGSLDGTGHFTGTIKSMLRPLQGMTGSLRPAFGTVQGSIRGCRRHQW